MTPVAQSPDPVVEVRDVTKRFGNHLAVDRLSLAIPRGSVYGFIGPNGSGKTTTLRMIMDIFRPDEGAIRVLGSDHVPSIRDRVAYLPEERGLYKKMSVHRVLRYYAELKGMSGAAADRAIWPWLDKMGLTPYVDKKVETLSKGMSQKVQFISAVVSEPEFVILDEPFSGLDPVNAEVLKAAVLELRARGVTILFSTHDMGMAEKLCDSICMIFKGKKVFDGTLDSIQSTYGQDTLRVKVADVAALQGLPGVESVVDQGNFQELRVTGDPQALLVALAAKTRVQHFELTRPTLHEIFVRIAQPEGGVYRHA